MQQKDKDKLSRGEGGHSERIIFKPSIDAAKFRRASKLLSQ